jgi:uncharacterized glyoxalase superfamily protein PhnB
MQTLKTKRPPRPVLMPWLTPALTVRDVSSAMDFYEKAFGFEKGESMPGPDGLIVHGAMKYQGSVVVMLGREGAFGCKSRSPATAKVDCPVNLYVYCPDVEALFQRAEEAGAKVVSRPEDMFWGDRTAQFDDLDGYRWTFATNVADFDASKAPK